MVTQIQLGNLFSLNGRSVLGGTASGLDSQTLIEGLIAARQQPATELQTKIDTNTAQIAAYSTLMTKVSALQTDVDALRNPPGVNNASSNLFAYRTANVSTNTGAAASNYLTVTAEPGATVQNFIIDNITSIAAAKAQSTGDFLISDVNQAVVATVPTDETGPTGHQFGDGTITITNPVTSESAAVTLVNGDTLQAVANKFNLVSATTGITAQIIHTDTNTFRLLFTATATGTDAEFDLTSGLHISDPGGALVEIIPHITLAQAASNAEFDFNNVTITRQGNSVTDLVDGVTFNLLQDTVLAPTTKLNVQIAPDVVTVHNAIVNFANDYNELKLFYAAQTARNPDGSPTEDAVLANSQTMRSIMTGVLAQVNSIVGGLTDGDPSQLVDIGITLDEFAGDADNPATGDIMTVDSAQLQSALQSNFSAVQALFGFTFTSSSNDLQVFSHTKPLGVNSFTLNINTATDTYEAIYTDSDDVEQTVDLTPTVSSGSVLLTGPSGTIFDGLQMIFTGTGTATIEVTATQGIADSLFNLVKGVTDRNTGTIKTTVDGLTDLNTRYETDIASINLQIERYRDSLARKFADLEASIARVNSILASLNAQSLALAASNG